VLGFRSSLKKVQAPQASESIQRPSRYRHRAMSDWERRLHEMMRVTWPCESSLEFQALWPSVSCRANGNVHRLGAQAENDDGEIGLSRAIWCLTRHLQPRTVVECGVGTGLHARFVLEALALNRAGHLYSIEPPVAEPASPRHLGLAVEPRAAQRWSLFADSGKRALPELLARIGMVDMIVYDNPRPDHETHFEINLAWGALKPGGVMIIDDIDVNGAYQFFIERHPDYRALVCGAEPIRPGAPAPETNRQFAILFKTQTPR